MHLTSLELENFRIYRRAALALAPGVTLVWGENGQGKTTLLEAIYYLSRISTPHTAIAADLLNWEASGAPVPFARLRGEVQRGGQRLRLEAVLQQEPSVDSSAPRLRRHLRLDGAPKRVQDFRGRLQTVLFSPQDLDIIAGSPSRRRRFLDELCPQIPQLQPGYAQALRRYTQALRQRNHLLKRLRAGRDDARQLDHWDALLSQAGAWLIQQRLHLTARLATLAARLHEHLAPPGQAFVLRYRSSFSLPVWQSRLAEQASLPDLSLLQQSFLEALDRRRSVEIERALTLTGPHRDDLVCLLDDRDLTRFGSRGQQRTAALTLKLAEAALLEEAAGEPPVLLLDDVFSELDQGRRDRLLPALHPWEQIVVTTTDFSGLPTTLTDHCPRVAVGGGRLAKA